MVLQWSALGSSPRLSRESQTPSRGVCATDASLSVPPAYSHCHVFQRRACFLRKRWSLNRHSLQDVAKTILGESQSPSFGVSATHNAPDEGTWLVEEMPSRLFGWPPLWRSPAVLWRRLSLSNAWLTPQTFVRALRWRRMLCCKRRGVHNLVGNRRIFLLVLQNYLCGPSSSPLCLT